MTFQPSAAQQAFFDWVTDDDGHCILNAVAGAGKTTTILNGIANMRGRVWFGVYNKKMADELKEKISERDDLDRRVEKWNGETRSFSKSSEPLLTSTFHSLGKSIIDASLPPRVRAEVDEKKVERIVDRLIAEREGADNQRRDDLRELKPAVMSIVSMAKNRGIGAMFDMNDSDEWISMIEHFDLDASLPEDVNLTTVLSFARTALKRSNKDTEVVDYDDMVYLPLARKMRVAPWLRFDWVLIDEAQDTNPTRRALATKVMKEGARLVAVGDPHQAIFGFTGADNDSLQQIGKQFNAKELPLTVSYRCPHRIVEHAQKWVSHIESHEGASEGSVERLNYMDLTAQFEGGSHDTFDPGETAILCRYNKPLVGLCFKLIRAGIPAKIEGRSIGDNLVKLATRWKKCVTLNALESQLVEYEEREVAKALKKEQTSKADRITDEVATLIVMIDRAREQKMSRVDEMVPMIEDMFADGVSGKGMITLCSTHKSKGLEWHDVYLLGREEFMPSKFAHLDWQLAQETNLIYVAVTRAMSRLIEVYGVVAEKDPTEKES
jgi:DNA helicase-2/ATP-dependent DNA helicase PcrA